MLELLQFLHQMVPPHIMKNKIYGVIVTLMVKINDLIRILILT